MSYKSSFVFTIVGVTILGLFVLPFQSSAQVSNAINNALTNLKGTNLSIQGLADLLKGLACYFIRFAIIATTTMMVVYGIMFLQSRGNPQGMTSAKKALIWGIVGAVVIFAVFTIILSVAALFGVSYPMLSC